jgi:hypothetical protein
MKMNFALNNKICDFLALSENCSYFAGHIIQYREGILGHQFITKDLSLLPNAIHSSFYLRILKKTYTFLVLKALLKNPRNKKTRVYP